jgi:hypothetical protein
MLQPIARPPARLLQPIAKPPARLQPIAKPPARLQSIALGPNKTLANSQASSKTPANKMRHWMERPCEQNNSSCFIRNLYKEHSWSEIFGKVANKKTKVALTWNITCF